jgi:hypothetical protein
MGLALQAIDIGRADRGQVIGIAAIAETSVCATMSSIDLRALTDPRHRGAL